MPDASFPERLDRRHVLALAAGAAALAGWPRSLVAGDDSSEATPDIFDGHALPAALIEPDALAAKLDDVVLVAFMPEGAFAEGHIAGSVRIDWPELEVIDTTDAGLAVWHETVAAQIGALGIGPESDVVVCDDGTLFAARLWWLLGYLGHDRVAVLNGGRDAWVAAGYVVETGPGEAVATDAGPYPANPRRTWLAQKALVLDMIGNPDVVIVDARAPDEYTEGHIPGAVNVNYPLNAAAEPPRTWLEPDALRTLYADAGMTPDRWVIAYCTSGVRSAVTVYALSLLGYPRVSLFTGSWQEWMSEPAGPVETGQG